VYSAGAGVVADAGAAGAYGRFVRVEHGGGLESFYAHLDRILARRGDSVRRGQVIGLAGSTGNATGPHLHFELRWRGRWVDPLAVLPALR
jgi:murein DD-endopeptidase MepM/ murein hydrolase activator NlpD